jgi:hypothetical protein
MLTILGSEFNIINGGTYMTISLGVHPRLCTKKTRVEKRLNHMLKNMLTILGSEFNIINGGTYMTISRAQESSF